MYVIIKYLHKSLFCLELMKKHNVSSSHIISSITKTKVHAVPGTPKDKISA